MPKYLIQDIIPPDRKNRSHGVPGHSIPHEVTDMTPSSRTQAHDGHHREHSGGHEAHTKETHTPEKGARKRVQISKHSHHDKQAEEEVVRHFPPPNDEPSEDETTEVAPEVAAPEDTAVPAERNDAGRVRIPTITNPYQNSYQNTIADDDQVSAGGSLLGRWLPWTIGVVAILAVLFFALSFFSGATVTVLPKRDAVPMDQKFIAAKEPAAGELPYAIVKVALTETREVPATGERTVTAKASGKIIIYNTQTVTQRLIKNTRFQSPSGKIYRINESIVVPKSTTAGGKVTPGSLEVTVYADEPGEAYNSEPVDFTVPGLKGGPLFDKVYARSKGSISGGASGTTKTVSDADLKQANDELRVALETKLRSKARGDITPNQIGYDRGMVIELKDPTLMPQQASSAEKAVVSADGTLYMAIFDREELAKAIARALIPTWAGEVITIANLDTLEFNMKTAKGEDLWSNDKLEFTLKGTAELAWSVQNEMIQKELTSMPRANFNATMAKYPMIDRATAALRPFWKRSFPMNQEDIVIKIVDKMEE